MPDITITSRLDDDTAVALTGSEVSIDHDGATITIDLPTWVQIVAEVERLAPLTREAV